MDGRGPLMPPTASRFVPVLLMGLLGVALVCSLSAWAGPVEDAESAYRNRDYGKALVLLEPLANSGNPRAQMLLGSMYATGSGVPLELQRAEDLFRKSAAQGNTLAAIYLASMYWQGRGVPRNLPEAAALFRQAAEQGNAIAQSNLGSMYRSGEGVPRDASQAAFWYGKAAEQGNATAQHNLATMYESPKSGIPLDHALAASWYRRAANQGFNQSQFALGMKYIKGEGVPQDDFEAYKWLTISVEFVGDRAPDSLTRNLALEKRSSIASRLEPARIAEAERIAKVWKPSPEGFKN